MPPGGAEELEVRVARPPWGCGGVVVAGDVGIERRGVELAVADLLLLGLRALAGAAITRAGRQAQRVGMAV